VYECASEESPTKITPNKNVIIKKRANSDEE
jgi:hypothetical protein